jgi:integrase
MLPESVKNILVERHQSIDSEWVFPSPIHNSLPLDPKYTYENIKKVLSKADLPYVQFHNLRHTFATRAISNGVEPQTLSNLMGHKIINFTLDTYTHGTVDMEKQMSVFIKDFMIDFMEESDE